MCVRVCVCAVLCVLVCRLVTREGVWVCYVNKAHHAAATVGRFVPVLVFGACVYQSLPQGNKMLWAGLVLVMGVSVFCPDVLSAGVCGVWQALFVMGVSVFCPARVPLWCTMRAVCSRLRMYIVCI